MSEPKRKSNLVPHSIRAILARRGPMLHEDITVDDILVPLAEAYDLLRQIQATRRAVAEHAVADAERINHYLEFVTECCGKRESNYNLSGNSGVGITLANAMKTIASAVDLLVAGDKGLLSGSQATSERDPMEMFYPDGDAAEGSA